jgi:hypothetical protein
MNPEQQIKQYEDCITRLEEARNDGSVDQSSASREIENAYRQIALLKIRKSMDSPF